MNHDDLNKTLQALHQELSDAQNINADTLSLLKTLTADIQKILENPAAHSAAESESDQDKSLSERLREAIIEFEVRHPQIGGLLERLTDGLASIGI